MCAAMQAFGACPAFGRASFFSPFAPQAHNSSLIDLPLVSKGPAGLGRAPSSLLQRPCFRLGLPAAPITSSRPRSDRRVLQDPQPARGGMASMPAAATGGAAAAAAAATGGHQIEAYTVHDVLADKRLLCLEAWGDYVLLGLSGGVLALRAGCPAVARFKRAIGYTCGSHTCLLISHATTSIATCLLHCRRHPAAGLAARAGAGQRRPQPAGQRHASRGQRRGQQQRRLGWGGAWRAAVAGGAVAARVWQRAHQAADSGAGAVHAPVPGR